LDFFFSAATTNLYISQNEINNKMPSKTKKQAKKTAAADKTCKPMCSSASCAGSGCCSYFLGFLGAAIYYISTAGSFWAGVVGFLKAIIWPVFLVYGLLKSLGL